MKRILVFLICLNSCISFNSKDQLQDSVSLKVVDTFVTDDFGNRERAELIDSLKWLFYALNCRNEAVNLKTSKLKLNPVQCEVALWKIQTRNDTCKYYFSTYYGDTSNVYVINPDDIIGIATVLGRPRYTLGGHFMYDKPPTPQSADSFFQKAESEFAKYITEYKGPLNNWLQNEGIKRNVIPKQ